MKKTFTKEEFKNLTNEVICNAMKEAESKNMSGGALMAYSMTYVIAFAELEHKLFDDDTNTIEITEKEF